MQANRSLQLLDRLVVQRLLDTNNLGLLFIEELGWDQCRADLRLDVAGVDVFFKALAQKRAFVAFEYVTPVGDRFPNYAQRAALESAVAKRVREHLLIFSSSDRAHQIWQWTKREMGRPVQRREHVFDRGRRDDLLVEKLSRLAISLEAEELGITIIDVAGRVRAAFDIDPITKRFYDGFNRQHDAFLGDIQGIKDTATRRWYASIMLNRLMFVYFIQRKSFLNGDANYLQTKLAESRAREGGRYFADYLVPLFFECLARPEADRSPDIARRIGTVPYLNGGLFKRHQIEHDNPGIAISDDAFANVFTFFSSFAWHLDDRPASEGNEISPDVLGYIFERYVNQAQMGAYYTKEDITEYIASFAILARLIAIVEAKLHGDTSALTSAWARLRTEPDRYIPAAVQLGVGVSLPDTLQPNGAVWDGDLFLKAETVAEMLRRRERYGQLRAAMVEGRFTDAVSCFRESLDVRQFVQDTIEGTDDVELLEAFYDAVTQVTVLDPACGSGAFLFAAMNVLEPLYEACLDKMGVIVGADGREPSDRLKRFASILAQSTESHPNQQYFILKQIALRNLFGVDIMDEAVEICKLRLFLKLIAQVEHVQDVEPLPDIDFNIKSGNSLVGFASIAQLERAIAGGRATRFDFGNDLEALRQRAELAANAFDEFRRSQSDSETSHDDQEAQKGALRDQLRALQSELNQYLARQYGVDAAIPKKYRAWQEEHRPFHWMADFFGIMASLRFDAIIGNPPYVVYPSAKVDYKVLGSDYDSLPCRNLYALMLERSLDLVAEDGVVAFIVPLTVTSSERVPTLQTMLRERGPLYYTSFPRRPQTVFDGVEMPVSIVTSLRGALPTLNSTRVERFYSDERPHLMTTLSYVTHDEVVGGYRLGKLGDVREIDVLAKMKSSRRTLEVLTSRSPQHVLYYQEACRYWAKISLAEPFSTKNGVAEFPDHWRKISFLSEVNHRFAFCLLNSSLFYWYYSTFSDCEHINDSLVKGFPIPVAGSDVAAFSALALELDNDLRGNATRKTINTRHGDVIAYDELSASSSKLVIDRIDKVLAQAYRFTTNELKYIQAYDIKYRSPE